MIQQNSKYPILLSCDGLKDQSIQDECIGHSNKNKITYTLTGWSQDFSRMVNSYDDSGLFERFVKVVNGQDKYNADGQINAIPIVIYHRIGESTELGYNTDLNYSKKK